MFFVRAALAIGAALGFVAGAALIVAGVIGLGPFFFVPFLIVWWFLRMCGLTPKQLRNPNNRKAGFWHQYLDLPSAPALPPGVTPLPPRQHRTPGGSALRYPVQKRVELRKEDLWPTTTSVPSEDGGDEDVPYSGSSL